jgi:2'-5' RNA ligase
LTALIRTFIAIELPDDFKEMLTFFQKELKKQAPSVRWISVENIHVTLKFLGEVEVERLAEIEHALDHVRRDSTVFSLRTKQFGGFPNLKKPRVCWLGFETSSEMLTLQRRIEDALELAGFERDSRTFSPHLTLGRIKLPQNFDALYAFTENNPFPACEIAVKEYCLIRSNLKPQGAVYTPIHRYSLDIYHK